MKEFLQSIFKSAEERVKNPFVGAFFMSWIIFNWKPMLMLIFSSNSIENKIVYVDAAFNDKRLIFLYPIISSIFYVLLLPYINLMLDEMLKYSISRRNTLSINNERQTIEKQKQLAIGEIMLEEAKTEFRERNTHNKLVEELQARIRDSELTLENEKQSNYEALKTLRAEINERDKIRKEEINNFERRYNQSQSEIINLKEKIHNRDARLNEMKTSFKDEFDDKLKEVSLLTFENGFKIVEKQDDEIFKYFDPLTRKEQDKVIVQKLFNNHKLVNRTPFYW